MPAKKTKRTEAIELGNLRYKTGKPCKRGHFSERNTIDASCVECRNLTSRTDRLRIRAILLEKNPAL